MDTFDRITNLLQENGMTQADLSRATGISTGLISQWKKRMQSPSTEKLKLIADYFNVTVDYLLGNVQESTSSTPNTQKEELLDSGFFRVMQDAQNRGYSPEDLELVLDFLDRARRRDQGQ